MSIIENIRMALISLRDNKMRTFLTMISIIIGLASVIAIVSIGRGASDNITNSVLSSVGTGLSIQYSTNDDSNSAMFSIGQNEDKPFTSRELHLLEQVPGVASVIPKNTEFVNLNYLDKNQSVIMESLDSQMEFDQTENIILSGRGFTDTEFEQAQSNILISDGLAKALFTNSNDAVGQSVVLKNRLYTIIGTYGSSGGNMFSMFGDKTMYLPFSSWELYSGEEQIGQVTVIPAEGADVAVLGQNIEQTLNSNKVVSGDYKVQNLEKIGEQVSNVFSIMTTFIAFIAGISLFVGGLGVTNIMYVSVVERTHEIGLRKALGATPSRILSQFLIEAMIITTLGGIIGIIFGLLISYIASIFVGFAAVLSPDIIIIGTLFSMLIGAVFGTFPARKASKMQPIDALRSL
ncbi:ABC transporter permease [Culicoidibacter larvae]|uniref:FtsX-like permease family protein n=1 Tax=Culicoidibacter larvae TaxID=2579976 RepID=A0A5R8QDB3_9FIRM|nr:ABC transporter permease [Culicoidibacter larvae]TLG74256.1 FtsX-like permease family protein [Culicoidibacter larvae]